MFILDLVENVGQPAEDPTPSGADSVLGADSVRGARRHLDVIIAVVALLVVADDRVRGRRQGTQYLLSTAVRPVVDRLSARTGGRRRRRRQRQDVGRVCGLEIVERGSFAPHFADDVRQCLDVVLRQSQSLYLGHFSAGSNVRDDLPQLLECVVQRVHPLAFPLVALDPPLVPFAGAVRFPSFGRGLQLVVDILVYLPRPSSSPSPSPSSTAASRLMFVRTSTLLRLRLLLLLLLMLL